MEYFSQYPSPVGNLLLLGDDTGLCEILFNRENKSIDSIKAKYEQRETPVLKQGKEWLDIYFSGKEPDFTPKLHLKGTAFRLAVWELLLQIPYGKTTTYGEIAAKIAAKRGIERMSARAVGGAVGHNPVPVIVPCHRVVGADNSLTGFTGGMDIKYRLLELEGFDMGQFTV